MQRQYKLSDKYKTFDTIKGWVPIRCHASHNEHPYQTVSAIKQKPHLSSTVINERQWSSVIMIVIVSSSV